MSQEPAPEVQGVPVTAFNWQDPPANRWAFWHVGDLLPTYRVPRGDGQVRPLPPAGGRPDLLAVPVTRMDRTGGAPAASTVGDVLGDTYTDAYLVLQDGQLVTEWYGPLGAPDRTHALMSVSKSVVGCVAAVLIDRGLLDPDAEITRYVPELAGSGYAGALVRHVYDMRSGVRFVEEYANPDSDIRRLDEWVGWQPGQGEPRGLYRFLATLQAEAPHGERFLYRSAESDVLGWVCERAAGRPMAELISELIWAPMGAEHDALLLHDGLGTAVHDGGLCATARDVARFGQMLLDGGLIPDGAGGTRRVVPPQWLRRAWAVDADARSVFAVVAGPEPELVPVPPAGERPLGGRRGEHAPGVGVDRPGPAQPLRRDHPAGAAGAIGNQPAVQQHLAEPGHVAGGGAQAPVVHGGAQAVVQQQGVVFGPHRCPDQLGDQLGHGQAGRALAHPAQHVGLGRTVQEPLAVRRLGLQRGQEPVEPAGLALAGLPFDPLVEPPDVRVRVGVLLAEPDPAAHVVDVPDQGADVAAAGQFGHVTRDLGVRVEQASVDEHGGHAA